MRTARGLWITGSIIVWSLVSKARTGASARPLVPSKGKLFALGLVLNLGSAGAHTPSIPGAMCPWRQLTRNCGGKMSDVPEPTRCHSAGNGQLRMLIALCSGAAGCSPDGGPAPYRVSAQVRGPSIEIVDSTILAEPDSAPIGATSALARSAAGATYVSDLAGGRIFKFGAGGQFAGAYGRKGDGPGEFQMPSTLTLIANDSLLVVVDPGREYVSILDAKTGQFVRGFKVPFQISGQSWTARGDTLVFSVFPGSHVFAQWRWQSDSIVLRGSMPGKLLSEANIVTLYGWPEVIPIDSGFIAVFPTEAGMRLLDRNGSPLASVLVPAARRRGDPPDLIEQHHRLESNGEKFRYLGSAPAGLRRLSSGAIAVFSLDLDRSYRPRGIEYKLQAYYLSLVSPDLNRACVDGRIPIESDGVSIPILVGDTLFMLSRRVSGNNRVRTAVYAFSISDKGCDWQRTGGPRPISPTETSPAGKGQ